MDDNTTNAPSSRAPMPVKVLGTLAIVGLIIAILLLAMKVITF